MYNRSGSSFILFLALIALFGTKLTLSNASAQTPDTAAHIQTAWDNARAAGSYHVVADVEQTLLPRPLPHLIGKGSQRIDMRVEGDSQSADYSQLTLTLEGSGLSVAPTTLIQNGDQLFIDHDGELRPANGSSVKSTGPGGDYMSYLAGASNVQFVESRETAAGTVEIYSFDYDGRQAALTMTKLSDQPIVGTFNHISGTGQLWINAEGLPVRQILDLDQPSITSDYDASMHMVIDYSRYGSAEIVPTISQNPDGSYSATIASGDIQRATSTFHLPDIDWTTLSIILVVVSGAGGWVLFYRYYPRQTYKYSLAALAGLLLGSAVLNPISIVHARGEQALQEQRQLAALGIDVAEAEEPAQFMKSAPAVTCGDGSETEDTDGDGLTDFAENCYGTNPYEADTDFDLIPDKVELDGVNLFGQLWRTDPLNPDTNGDDRSDGTEYAESSGGIATTWDYDGDQIPNPWDDDDDNDGVLDRVDLSPESRSNFGTTFELNTAGAADEFYHYIDVQIRPEQDAQLRYTQSTLDWPYDNRGNMRDLNQTRDDIKITPMLLLHSDYRPNETLAQRYGVTVFPERDDEGRYEMVVPLAPTADGGQIMAFQGRIAYEPQVLNDASWELELVWAVTAKNDVERQRDQTTVLHYYRGERFRVTGYNLVRSGDASMMLLRTPDTPDDDSQLFQLLFGLNQSILSAETLDGQSGSETVFDEVAERFNTNSSDVARWGVAQGVSTEVASYGHLDEMMADTAGGRIVRFLNRELPVDDVSIIIATEQQLSAQNMDSLGKLTVGSNELVQMSDGLLFTERALKLARYRPISNNNWQPLDTATAITSAIAQYADLSTVLTTLQAEYPDLTESSLRQVLTTFYYSWLAGAGASVQVDGTGLLQPVADDQAIYDSFFGRIDTHLVATLIELTDIAAPGGGLLIGTGSATNFEYFEAEGTERDWSGLSPWSIDVGKLGLDLNWRDERIVHAAFSTYKGGKTLLKFNNARKTRNAFIKANQTPDEDLSFIFGRRVNQVHKAHTYMRAASKIEVGMLILELAVIWTVFALTTDFDDPIAVGYAVAAAVAATIFAFIFFAMQLNPITAVLSALIALADFIFFVITGDSFMTAAIAAVASLFYDASFDQLTEVDSAEFSDFESELDNVAKGFTIGNAFTVRGHFRGIIDKTSYGDNGNLDGSYLEGRFNTTDSDGTASNAARNCRRQTIGGKMVTVCDNDVAVRFELNQAMPDLPLTFTANIVGQTKYRQCQRYVVYTDCDTKSNTFDSPEEPTPTTVYLDILPDTVGDIWTMDRLTNYDLDFDGLRDSAEPAAQRNSWDSDGDGLSDRYERDSAATLFTHAGSADADGDTLNDRRELTLGTNPSLRDSDGDLLSDLEEITGWAVQVTPTQSLWVYSDPLLPDADGDGFNDSAERTNQTSPHAYNPAPTANLIVTDLGAAIPRMSDLLLAAGDQIEITFGLDNPMPQTLSTTASLCIPQQFDAPAAPTLTGDRTVVGQVAGNSAECPAPNHHFTFDFTGSNTLNFTQQVSTSLSLTASSTSGSGHIALAATAPAGQLLAVIPVLADADDPTVTISDPNDGTFWLNSGTTSFIVGGSASDPSSGIAAVALTVNGNAQGVTGNQVWASRIDNLTDGDYSISAFATDAVGHQSPTAHATLRVDHTAPVVTLNFAAGATLPAQTLTRTVNLPLNGTVSDAVINGVSSGVLAVSVSVDGRPWRQAVRVGNDWSFDWQLNNVTQAQGEHTIEVQALDVAGNLSESATSTFIIDVVEPTSSLTDSRFRDAPPVVVVNEPMTVRGVADDAGNLPQSVSGTDLVGALESIDDATVWISADSIHSDDSGVSIEWIGDFDGDRLADFVVGLPNDQGGLGTVTIVYGQAGDWQLPPLAQAIGDSRTSFRGLPNAPLGQHVAALGDVNGDQLDDFAVVVPEINRAYVVFGTVRGLGLNQDITQPTAGIIELQAPDGRMLDGRIAAAGDVNGDTLDDILIGSDDTTLTLMPGRPRWLPAHYINFAALTTLTAPSGSVAVGVQDATGDGFGEFVLATPADQSYLFHGSPTLAASLTTADANDTFAADGGVVAALGDINGDLLADFALADSGGHQVVFGDLGGTQCCFSLAGMSPAADGFIAAVGNVRDSGSNTRGLNDILVGTSTESAYLILGSTDLSTASVAASVIAATIDGVAAAANTPFAAGADINADGSSDLLLLPSLAAAEAYGFDSYAESPFVPPRSLPVAPPVSAENTSRNTVTGLRYVDDDGNCAGLTPCHNTIQAAIDAAADGDTLTISPGVYSPFSIINRQNLTVRGVHADAVFIDAGGSGTAILLDNSTGITLGNLTVRASDIAFDLVNAGVTGYADPTLINHLDHILFLDFSQHALRLDRLSMVTVANSTLVGTSSTQPYVHVGSGTDTAFFPAWSGPFAPPTTSGAGAQVIARDATSAWVLAGGNSSTLHLFDATNDSFTPMADIPGLVNQFTPAVSAGGELFVLSADNLTQPNLAPTVPLKESIEDATARYDLTTSNTLIEQHSGTATTLASIVSGSSIDALFVSAESVFLGGNFQSLRDKNGQTVAVQNIAVIDRATGAISAGYAHASPVHTLAFVAENTTSYGSLNRARLYAATTTGQLVGAYYTPSGSANWQVQLIATQNGTTDAGRINVMRVEGNFIYLGGRFDRLNCQIATCRQSAVDNVAQFYSSPYGQPTTLSGYHVNSGGVIGSNAEVFDIAISPARIIVGGRFELAGTADQRATTRNIAQYSRVDQRWLRLGSGVVGTVHSVGVVGNNVYAAGDFQTTGTFAPLPHFARWDADAGWQPLPDVTLHNGATLKMNPSGQQPGSLLLAGDFTQFGVNNLDYLARLGTLMQRRTTAGNWVTEPSPPFPTLPERVPLTHSPDGTTLYALLDGGVRDVKTCRMVQYYNYTYERCTTEYDVHFYDLWLYDIGASNWQRAQAGLRMDVAENAFVATDDAVYVLKSDGTPRLWRYDLSDQLWSELATPPTDSVTWGAGANLAWDGAHFLYATTAGQTLMRYELTLDLWEPVTGQAMPFATNDDSQLIQVGNRLVAFDAANSQLHEYGRFFARPEKLTITNTLFVAPEVATQATWLNQGWPQQADDFGVTLADNAWVGGSGAAATWNIIPLATALPFEAASFKEPAFDLYRLSGDSQVDVGYQPFAPDAEVRVAGCPQGSIGCFDTIQAAILSGANEVTLLPGQYREPFYLVNGVDVYGSDAEQVILIATGSETLISAENTHNRLTNLTLDGSGTNNGLVSSDGASVTLSRSLLRNNGTAVTSEGGETVTSVINNTFVGNQTGIVSIDCAPVDVRNTIFAQTTGAALAYSDCGQTIDHSYNLYFENGNDFPSGSAEIGAVFSNPLFTDPSNDNYRVQFNSPANDAGDPSDPAPPNSDRIDIGYREIGRSGYYVDDDYCATCLNDGLVWERDAFATIQAALNAAKSDIMQRTDTASAQAPLVTVNVAPGTYRGDLTMPSYVHLEGSGADVTHIARNNCRAIMFGRVVHSKISDFTISYAGNRCTYATSYANIYVGDYSNNIVIERNVIADAYLIGIEVSRWSNAIIRFNTIADNGNYGANARGIVVNNYSNGDAVTSAEISNNIIYRHRQGLTINGDADVTHDYNLFVNNVDDASQTIGDHSLITQAAQFVDAPAGTYRLLPSATAIDRADPTADVPTGGGATADIGYQELQARPLTVLFGDGQQSAVFASSGIAQVEVGISFANDPATPITATLPTNWTAATLGNGSDAVRYWDLAHTPTQVGTYRVYSRASDGESNSETAQSVWFEGSFAAADLQINWLAPTGNAAAPLELRAELAGYTPHYFGDYTIYFEVDGDRIPAEWAVAPFVPDGSARPFSAWAKLSDGAHQLRAVAVTANGNVIQSAIQNLTVTGQNSADLTPPTVALNTTRVANNTFTIAVQLDGTIVDSDSGIRGVEISVNNGVTWIPAATSGNNWSFLWEPPVVETRTSYPALLRGTDRAGNDHVIEIDITVDNSPPPTLPDIGVSIEPGTHVPINSSLTVTWTDASAGGDPVTMLVTLDRNATTLPAQPIVGNQLTDNLDQIGDWYAHIGVQDSTGNTLIQHIGPYIVNNPADPTCSNRSRSIILDGQLDLLKLEWLSRERIDDDERATIPQQLYTTWDGQYVYLAWQGAWWDIDGTLWVYFDTATGGAAQSVVGGVGLPISADYALQINGKNDGLLWEYNGAWNAQPFNDFALGSAGIVEARLPFRPDNLQMIAYGSDDADTVFSVFPTTNALSGNWQAAYQWNDLCATGDPAANQPRHHQTTVRVIPPRPANSSVTHDDALAWQIVVRNDETQTPLTTATVVLSATAGLQFESSIDGRWTEAVPTLGAGVVHIVTINGLTEDRPTLELIDAISTTVALEIGGVVISADPQGSPTRETITYYTDIDGPELAVTSPFYISPSQRRVAGSASDETAVIQIAMTDARGNYIAADGTLAWSSFDAWARFARPSYYGYHFSYSHYSAAANAYVWGAYVQATDALGNKSEPILIEIVPDYNKPIVKFDAPRLITTTLPLLTGTVYDDRTIDALVLEIDGFDPVPIGVDRNKSQLQNWLLRWNLGAIDGEIRRIRVVANDAAEQSDASPWVNVTVDNVPPSLSATQQATALTVGDKTPPPILTGTASDGSTIADLFAIITLPNGTTVTETIPLIGQTWAYAFGLPQAAAGAYTVEVVARDIYELESRTSVYSFSVPATPDLEIVAIPVAPSALPGSTFTYTLVVTNNGSIDATNTVVTATLPSELSAVGASSWQLGTLAPNATDMVTMTAVWQTPLAGTQLLDVTFGVDSAEVDFHQSDNHTTVTTSVADEVIQGVLPVSDAPTIFNQYSNYYARRFQTLNGAATHFTATVTSGSNVKYTWLTSNGTVIGQGPTLTQRFGNRYGTQVRLRAENGVSVVTTNMQVIAERPALYLRLDAHRQVLPGERITYTLRFGNGSSSGFDVENGNISLGLPSTASDVQFSSTHSVTAVISATKISWQLAPLPHLSSGTIVVGFVSDATQNTYHQAQAKLSAPALDAYSSYTADYATGRAVDSTPALTGMLWQPYDQGGSWYRQNLTTNKAFTLTPYASGSNLHYEWTFSNGAQSNGITATQRFADVGNAWAELRISNSSGSAVRRQNFDVKSADIAIQSITPSAQQIVPGESAEIDFTVRNVGAVDLVGTQVTITLPADLTFDTLSASQTITPLLTTGQTRVWELSPQPLTNRNIQFTLGVTVTDGLSGFVPLTATISTDHLWDSDPAQNVQTALITASDGLITDLTATAPQYTYLGDTTYVTATTSAGAQIEYDWSTGDGASASGNPANHVYGQIGDYALVVTATNSADIVTATTQTSIVRADLAVSKSAPASVQSGDLLTYTIYVTNTGVLPASNVLISESVPAELSGITTTITVANGTLVTLADGFVWQVAELGAGESAEIVVTATVAANLLDGVPLNTTTTISSPHPETALADNQAVATINATERAITTLIYDDNSPIYAGELVSLTAAAADATDVLFGWEIDGATLVGAAVTKTLSVASSYPYTLTASNDVSTQTVTGTVSVVDPNLVISTTANATSVPIGGTATFDIHVYNDTPLPVTDAVLTVTLDANLHTPTFTTTHAMTQTGNTAWQLAEIAPFAEVVVVVSADVTNTITGIVPMTNTVSVAQPRPETTLLDNTATRVITATDVGITGITIERLTLADSFPHGYPLINVPVVFTATTASGTGINYSWDLGDGTSATGAVVTHTYTSVATDVEVTVTAVNSTSVGTASELFDVLVADLNVKMQTFAGCPGIGRGAVGDLALTRRPGDVVTIYGCFAINDFQYQALFPIDSYVMTLTVPLELQHPTFSVDGLTYNDLTVTQVTSTTWQMTFSEVQWMYFASPRYEINGTVAPTLTGTNVLTHSVTTPDKPYDDNPSNNFVKTVITVIEPIDGLQAQNSSPVAVGTLVDLTATITAGIGTSEQFVWDFGDGTTGVGQSTAHLYASPGTYSAIVTATNFFSEISASTLVTVTQSDLQIGLRSSAENALPSDIITYTAHITDAGILDVDDALLTLAIPSDLTLQTITASVPLTATSATTWEIAPLTAQQAATVTITMQVNPALVGNVSLAVTATVTSTVPDGNPTNNVATATITAGDSPIGGGSAENDSPTFIGQPVTFNGAATGSGIAYSWAFGDGNNGSGATATHSYANAGIYTATLTASNGVSSTIVTTTVTIYAADLAISNIASVTDVATGSAIQYTVTVTNNTPLTVTGVTLSDALPSSFTLDNVTTNVPVTTITPTEWQLEPLAIGAVVELVLDGTFDHSLTGLVTSSATISTPLASAPRSATATVNLHAGLRDAAIVSDAPILATTTAHLTATVTGGDNPTYTWEIDGTAATGVTATQRFDTVGDYLAIVEIADGYSTAITGTTIAVIPADVEISAETPATNLTPNDPITITLTITNATAVAVPSVVISDVIPAYLTTPQVTGATMLGGNAWQTGAIPAGATLEVTLAGQIDAAATAGDYLHETTIRVVNGTQSVPENNLGDNVTAYLVTISDEPISGLTVQTDQPAFRDETITFTATITSGATTTYAWAFGDGTVGTGAQTTHSYSDAGKYTAIVTATSSLGSDIGFVSVDVVAAELAIAGDVSADTLVAGEWVTYTLTVSNNSDLPLSGAIVTATLPSRLTNHSYHSDLTLTPLAGLPYSWQLPELAANSVHTITVRATVSAGQAVPLNFGAAISSPQREDDLSDNQSSTTVSMAEHILSLTAAQDSPVPFGQVVNLNASVTAGGAVSFVWTFGDGTGAIGAAQTHLYDAPGDYTATVTATNSISQVVTSLLVRVIDTDLVVRQTATRQSAEPNTPLSFTIIVTNAHDLPLASVVLTDTLHPALQNVTVTTSEPITQTGSDPYVWQLPTLAAQQSLAITLTGTVTPTIDGVITLFNDVVGWQPLVERNTANNQSTAIVAARDSDITGLRATGGGDAYIDVPLSFSATSTGGSHVTYTWAFGDGTTASGANVTHSYAQPGHYVATVTARNGYTTKTARVMADSYIGDLQISNAVSHDQLRLGDAIQYTLTFTNAGGYPVSDVVITDLLPSELQNVRVSGSLPFTTLPNGWEIAQLSVGQVGRLVISADTPTNLSGIVTITNTASIDSPTIDHRPANNSSTVTTLASDNPIIGLIAANDSPHPINQTVSLTATIQSGSAVSYDWTFGDGAVGSGALATHSYSEPGIYTATVTASNGLVTTQAATQVVILAHDLAVSQQLEPAVAIPGQDITATITITNSGGYTATGITLSETVPQLVAIDGIAATVPITVPLTPPTLDVALPDMAAGDVIVITVTGVLSNPVAGTQTLTTTAIVTADRDDLPSNDRADATLLLGDLPIQGLTATNSGVNFVNGNTIFSTTISSGSNVVYTWSFGDGSPPVVGDLQVGADVLSVLHSHVYQDSASYTPVVTASNGVSVQTFTLPAITVLAGDLAITQTVLTPDVLAGERVSYTLNYVNQGQQAVDGGYILHYVPTELVSVTVETSNRAVLRNAPVGPVFDLPTLAIGGSGVLTVSGTVDPALGQSVVVTSSAYIHGNLADDVPQNNTTTAQLTLRYLAPPTVQLVNPGALTEGDTAVFEVTVSTDLPTRAAHALTLNLDFGNGITLTAPITDSATFTQTLTDDALYGVTASVSSGRGAYAESTLAVPVANAVPVVQIQLPAERHANEPIAFAGSFSDAGSDDTHTFEWVFENGITVTDTLTPSFVYTAQGTYTVTLTVVDDDGGIGRKIITFQVGEELAVGHLAMRQVTPYVSIRAAVVMAMLLVGVGLFVRKRGKELD